MGSLVETIALIDKRYCEMELAKIAQTILEDKIRVEHVHLISVIDKKC